MMSNLPENPPVSRSAGESEQDSPLLRLALALPSLAAIVHTVRHRTLHEYQVYSTFLGAAMTATILASFVRTRVAA